MNLNEKLGLLLVILFINAITQNDSGFIVMLSIGFIIFGILMFVCSGDDK